MNKYEHYSKKAQERRRHERMCGRKRAYLSRNEAERDAGLQEVYHCPYCGCWHRSGAVARLAKRLDNKQKRKS